MKKYVKKKGSSFVVVIGVTSVIFILATAMLGMVVSGYKSRIVESKKLQNMYESDSKLDIVYNIIRKTSDASIIKASKDVEEISDRDKQNETFKENFLNNLMKGLDEEDTNNANLEKCIQDCKFPEYVVGGSIRYVNVNSYKDAEIKVTRFEFKDGEKKINITVRSTFETNEGKNRNTKTIEANFVVQAPEYRDIDVTGGTDIELSPVYNRKIITADGDMTASGAIYTKGDIWVKGIEGMVEDGNKVPNYSSDKYRGGILLEGEYSCDAGSNIYTSRTLNIRGTNTNANIEGNIYSLNTYLGGFSDEQVSDNSLTINGDLITNNDLTINSAGSSVMMTNYYGINEETFDYSFNPNLAARESSCIIVNNTNETNLIVTEDAYIMGVAYIDTKIKYQTGESVAIKGNYVAYTDPGTNENVTLKYYDPLQLIEFSNSKSILQDKEDHFINYFSGENLKNLKKPEKGIIFNKIHSAGAYVNGSGAYKGNITDDSEDIDTVREQFAINVLAMGDSEGEGDPMDLYNNGAVVRTVENQVNFDGIVPDYHVNEFYGKVILNNEKDEPITISPGIITVGNKNIELNEKDMRAFIVTNGDIVIDSEDGDINFTGNIMTTGNVEVRGGNNINLIYNSDVTNHIYAINKEYFNTIFIQRSEWNKVHVNFLDNMSGGLSDNNEKDYLKKGTWRIIK